MPSSGDASAIGFWLLALTPVLVFALALTALTFRRAEIRRFEQSHKSRAEAKERGSHKARLLHPDIDLTRCIGCGSCVRACPEDGVLDLLHGQAVVVHGARCVGHARCAEVCPTGAIALTFADLSDRKDLPAVDDKFEAVGIPGLFIAGELTGFSLVRTAVSHGVTVADAVAKALATTAAPAQDGLDDLLIVGMGPAGLSCALRCKELGLRFTTIDQAEAVGGTVAAYPRRKMVMTQPVHLPLYGKMPRLEYMKEELVELWQGLIAKNNLPFKAGVRLGGLQRQPDGTFVADTSAGPMKARTVCLALGRRGSPRKLGVPGENLEKVCYSLLDAESYKGRKILVVGGGDSAIEAVLGLAEQEGNKVTLAYRSKEFFRLKAKNDSRIRKAMDSGSVAVLFETTPVEFRADDVVLKTKKGETDQEVTIPNDDVFIFAGGEPPFAVLEKAGVSFDAEKRAQPVAVDQGTALIWAVGALLAGALGMCIFGVAHGSYYSMSHEGRAIAADHSWLRPAGRFGLGMGVLAFALFVWNLTYLLRRSASLGRFLPGSLKFWMGTHVFTGLASFMCVLMHSGFALSNTVGGFALLALGIVLVSGIIGRYFYAQIPHAANGREMDLDELRSRLASLSTAWERGSRGLGDTVRAKIDALVDRDRWQSTLPGRIREMVMASFRIRKTMRELRADPSFVGVPPKEQEEMLRLAKRAYLITVQIAHYEEMRAVLSSWRFVHRWLALLMVLFVFAHVLTAVRYAHLEWPKISAVWGGGSEGDGE